MKTYTIYVEFFGKKLKTTLRASSEIEAKRQVTSRLHFLKIVEEKDKSDSDIIGFFNDLFK